MMEQDESNAVAGDNADIGILIVDDDFVSRQLLRHMFETYRVTEARNGQEALDILRRQSFDVILLDIMMPDVNGLEVLQVLQSMPEHWEAPVILITAIAENKQVARGLQMGASDYITKPIDVDVVRARVKTQIKLKRLMDENRRTIEELRAAQQIREQFFRIATHDLKGPLANVRMAEYILRDFVQGNPHAEHVLDNLLATVNAMQGVIEDFLDQAALQTGRVELEMGPLPVEPAVREVVAQYAMQAADKGITITMEDLPGTVLADSARFAQIIGNLLQNAIKFSPRNGAVRLWSEPGAPVVRISVADSGPGIPEREREKLFKEFSKLSTRPTGGESSTGLGLWIVSHLMALHDGQVGVDCPPGAGSIFWVEFPMGEPQDYE